MAAETRLKQRQTDMKAKLTDQEGRSRRDNLHICGIPEEAEGEDMIGFLENLLKRALDSSHDEQLRTERVEVLHKAWQKKEVFSSHVRFYVDHDYPPAVLKEYSEAMETPYPARLWVFYKEGTRLYQSAAEATRDMASQGFPVSVVKPLTNSVQEEVQLLAERQVVTRRPDHRGQVTAKAPTQAEKTVSPSYREKLQEFGRRSSLED
ncbi:hypothetical protein MHYP_G00309440 [Metynnis hypsauchen]